MKTSGKFVETKGGLFGKVIDQEKPINGKLIVHITDPVTFAPVIDEVTHKPKKILCEPETLVIKGFFHKRY